MLKKRFIPALLLMMFTMISMCNVQAESSPKPMLKSLSDKVILALQKNKATIHKNPFKVYGVINQYLIPHVDAVVMARNVLGGSAWTKASLEQKKKFKKQFIKLVIRSYAGALAQFNDEKIEFTRVNVGGKRARVYSRVTRSGGPNIQLNYRLVLRGENWKIYDMIIEGVSILSSYRSQFSSELTRMNLDQLTAKLKRLNAEKK